MKHTEIENFVLHFGLLFNTGYGRVHIRLLKVI